MVKTAVILAAGIGSRLRTIISNKPKGFINIGDISLIERSIKLLKEAGIKKIYVVTGYLSHYYTSLSKNYIVCFIANYYINLSYISKMPGKISNLTEI